MVSSHSDALLDMVDIFALASCWLSGVVQSYAQIESALEQLDTTCMEQQQHPAPAASSSPTVGGAYHHDVEQCEGNEPLRHFR